MAKLKFKAHKDVPENEQVFSIKENNYINKARKSKKYLTISVIFNIILIGYVIFNNL